MFDSPWPSHWEAVVLAWLGLDFIKFASTPVPLYQPIDIMLLVVSHKLASAFVVLLHR